MYEYKTVFHKVKGQIEIMMNELAAKNWRMVPGSLSKVDANICVVMEREVGSYKAPKKKEPVAEVVVQEPVQEVVQEEITDDDLLRAAEDQEAVEEETVFSEE